MSWYFSLSFSEARNGAGQKAQTPALELWARALVNGASGLKGLNFVVGKYP